MGMSIDEHKEHLLDIMDSMPDDACGDWRDSLSYAIETMRKYQKIAELYDYWRSGKCEYTISCMENIGKILREVEDGKDN